ncbi:hypothetical protein ACROYT_G002543 [Oculina patagonica]
MGSWVSTEEQLKKQSEDQKRRQNLEDELKGMQYSLKVTASSHFIASEYYRNLDIKLQYASVLTATLGTTGGVLSKLAWKMMVAESPRLAPLLVASSATSLLFTAVVNIPNIPNSPGTLHQLHYQTAIRCQYLEKRVKFFAKNDVWSSDVAWATLASRYDNFLKEKNEVNSRVHSQSWSFRKALEKLDDYNRRKKQDGKTGAN